MVELGLPISYEEPVPIEEYINNLFDKRKKEATEIINVLPARYNFVLPALNALYDEIYECILFGLNGSAITLCGILVEFALKKVTYFYENGRSFTYNRNPWDEFENLTLGPAIDRAKKTGIIDVRHESDLKKFKDDVRNPYNHYNIKKIIKDVVARNVKVFNIKTLEQGTRDFEARDHPMIHAQAKRHVDNIAVYPILAFTDKVVKFVLSKLKETNES